MSPHHLFGRAAAQGTVGLHDAAMGQGKGNQFLNVVRLDVIPPLDGRLGLGSPVQGQGAARAGPQLQLAVVARRVNQAHDVAPEAVLNMHLPDGPAQFRQRGPVHRAGQGLDGMGLAQIAHHRQFMVEVQVAQPELEQEPIQLRFRQRERTFVLDGILGGQDHEGTAEAPRHPLHGDLALAHALQQGRLGARRGAVDFVGQEDLREGRAFNELELPGGLVEDRHARNVAGQEVGGALQPAEIDVECDRQGTRQHGLAHTGHILQQNMPFTQKGDHQQVDRVVVADNDVADRAADAVCKCLDLFHEAIPWLVAAAGSADVKPAPS